MQVGFPTDERALQRLPIDQAIAAIVSADVDAEDVDTQITDSEVVISALQLRKLIDETPRARNETPFSLIVEFNDVLTRRLLARQPELLMPSGAADVKVVYLHRNYLETAALSISAHSYASWAIMQQLLDARSGARLLVVPALDVIADETDKTSPSPSPSVPSSSSELRIHAPPFGHEQQQCVCSFKDLSARVSARGLGVLIGWRRQGDPQKLPRQSMSPERAAKEAENKPLYVDRLAARTHNGPVMIPKNADEKLLWLESDELVIMGRHDLMSRQKSTF